MVKAHAIWNQQDRSTVAANSIYAGVGRRLAVPNMTRWNSTYDSVVVINTILETKRLVLHTVIIQLKFNSFNNQDVDLMKECAKVMSLVAKGLDKIQGKEQAYFGTLLPTVVATIFRLVYYSPLVNALLAGIDKRMMTSVVLEDEECQLIAAFHPRFHLIWLDKYENTKVAKARKAWRVRSRRS
ncbi:uncharacterized protein LOC118762081 [Octopus sinensis]|uniref:Uncharacterized protein LOC118762081 n=1 Tax=Octopus sinensis TaxID=2607531 RepID=A0A7E6EKT8_9MOLL|nr:uncharacterized protein LOC118762081 [Octopus sinensis]